MHRSLSIRLLAAAAMIAPASLAAVALAGPASATTYAASCSTLNANLTGAGTVTGCAPAGATGGSGALATPKAGTGVITWNGTGTTTTTYTDKAVKKSKCAKGLLEYTETGKVTAGTGAAVTTIKVGSATAATVCVNTKAKTVVLLKGTKFDV